MSRVAIIITPQPDDTDAVDELVRWSLENPALRGVAGIERVEVAECLGCNGSCEEVCHDCRGNGVVETEDADAVCETCMGSGGEPCRACDARGWVL